jgi:hypothetical protein
MSLDTGNTTSPGPTISASQAGSTDNNYVYNVEMPQYNNVPSVTGLYQGTLSAQGNLVAMQVNPGAPKFKSLGISFRGADPEELIVQIPYLTGYLREYWKDPTQATFGANSAIPALTGVMPASIAELQGNALYYVDLQLTRLSGSNFFDNYAFINSFNQILGWVTTSNEYLAGLKNSQENNLGYYGAKNYQEFLTQGFSNYVIGNALRTAIGNIGTMITEIKNGHFGTANSVAKHLLDKGLGAIGDLSTKLIAADVNFSNIYDDLYTQDITLALESITGAGDLVIIQTVLGSNIPNISNPLDYTSIERVSGAKNDSAFSNFQTFGLDLYQRAPGLTVANGQELLSVIDQVLAQVPSSVESLSTPTSLLPAAIIDGLRAFLPTGPNSGPISILNVIGMASGYLISQITAVNQGIDQLNKTSYGNQIRTALTNVSKTYTAYSAVAATTTIFTSEGTTETVSNFSQPIIDNARRTYNAAVESYNNILSAAATDPQTSSIVEKINKNWLELCQFTYYEVVNYNKANITAGSFNDNSLIYGFVNSLPSYAADSQSLGTDYLLFGMCQPNQAGDIVKSLLNQNKNNNILSSIGVRITGAV